MSRSRLDSACLPHSNWRPKASKACCVLAVYRDGVVSRRAGEATDDPKGINNYWEATQALGKKSPARFKWVSELGHGERVLDVVCGPGEWKGSCQAADQHSSLADIFAKMKPLGAVKGTSAAISLRTSSGADSLIGHNDQHDVWVVDNEAPKVNQNKDEVSQPPAKKSRFQFGIKSKEPQRGTFHAPPPVAPKWTKAEEELAPDDAVELSPDQVRETANPAPPTEPEPAKFAFKTANEKLLEDYKKRYAVGGQNEGNKPTYAYGASSKTLGANRHLMPFRPPVAHPPSAKPSSKATAAPASSSTGEDEVDERLKNVDAKMVELVKNEIMLKTQEIGWDDIAGLTSVKTLVREIIVLPLLRPDLFSGLRGLVKGLLLFGPPGTGKTMIGKCIASQSGATFFNISASSLTSKWVGEGEKMVRALFAVARVHSPAVIFIDEIDSILTARSDTEHESSRRLKTEFLVQLVRKRVRSSLTKH